MDIVQERLEREYDLDLITSAPTVIYEVLLTDGSVINVDNPTKLPPQDRIAELREPIITANILVPPDYVGAVLTLCSEKRGVQKKMLFLGSQVSLQYELPLAEVVLDFFDRLKSASRGYASFDYEFSHFQTAPLVKLDVLINGDPVDALSLIVHKDNAYNARPRAGRQDAGADSAPDVRGGRAGRDRQPHHRARERQGDAQERAGQVLRRRHHAQAQAAREAEGRQEAHEAGRPGRDTAGGVSRRFAGRQESQLTFGMNIFFGGFS
jgi:hypothetical protein